MKKILMLFAVAGLIFAPIAFAATSQVSGYYSTQHPETSPLAAGKSKSPYIDITVINSSYDVIYATVPGSQVYERVFPNQGTHIFNRDHIFWTHLRILDPSQNPYRAIFDGDVCRRAIVTVYGGPGAYTTNVNGDAC